MVHPFGCRQAGVLMNNITLDKFHDTFAAAATHTALFHRDTRIEQHVEDALANPDFQGSLAPGEIDLERLIGRRHHLDPDRVRHPGNEVTAVAQ